MYLTPYIKDHFSHNLMQAPCGRVLMLISLALAPVLFISPFFVSPPLEADGTPESLNGGCLAIRFYFSSRPPATLAVRGRCLTGGLPYYSICVSFKYFVIRFSWLHGQAVQSCGSGFCGTASSTHGQFIVSGTGTSTDFSRFCIYMRLIKVGKYYDAALESR